MRAILHELLDAPPSADGLGSRIHARFAAVGGVVSGREMIGRPISMADAQIASICRKLRATLATRNIRDFDNTGIDVIDPWNPR